MALAELCALQTLLVYIEIPRQCLFFWWLLVVKKQFCGALSPTNDKKCRSELSTEKKNLAFKNLPPPEGQCSTFTA